MSTPLFHYLLIHWLIAFIPISLGIFVISKDRNNPLYRAFLRYNFVISWWGLFNLFMEYSKNEQQALFWDRISLLGIVFIPATFLHFTWMYSGKSKHYKSGIRLCYLLSTFFFVFVFTPLMAESATPKYIIPYFTDPGLFYHFFVFYFVCVMTLGNVLVFKACIAADSPQRRTGTRLFLIATSLSTIGGGGNFMVPYKIYTPILYPYGGYAFIIYGLLITYTILRYKFLDIEVIIKKTLIFAGLSSFVIACFSIPLFLIPKFVAKSITEGLQLCLLVVAGMIVAALVGPLNRILINVTDKYLFQKKFDYRKVLKDASTGLSRVNSLKYQLKLVTHFLTSRARIKSVAIYMPENGKHDFVLKERRSFDGAGHCFNQISFDSQILMYLKKERHKPYLEYYELEENARKSEKIKGVYKYNLLELKTELQKLRAHLIVPSFYQDELQGILVLGEKRSEDPYNEEDINLFQTIAQESAIAFENARKHDELVAQREELARINEELRRTQAEVIQVKEEAAVAALSAGISHEVKNAIYSLVNGNEQIKEAFTSIAALFKELYNSKEPLSPAEKSELFQHLKEGMQAVEQIEQASEHIDDVAHTLSEMSKGQNAQMGRIDLRTFVKAMIRAGNLRTYKDRAMTQAFDEPPEVDIPSDLAPVRAHTGLLRSVFINLFRNAIHAMNHVSPKKVRIWADVDPVEKNMVRIEFSDNGCGIPPENLPKIFNYQFTTKGEQGEGKGLYNVKNIIEGEHRGKIEVQSIVGKGTTFILKIPIWKDEEK